MGLIFEPEITYYAPEGKYRAVCSSYSENDNAGQPEVRLTFELVIPDEPGKRYLVARTFIASLDSGSKLRRFLKGWLGEAFIEQQVGKHFNPRDLIDREADVLVTFKHNPSHKEPFRELTEAKPPGSMRLTRRCS